MPPYVKEARPLKCTIIVRSATLSQPAQSPPQIVTQHKPARLSRHKKIARSLATLARVSADSTKSRSEILKTPGGKPPRNPQRRDCARPSRSSIAEKPSWSLGRPQCLLYGPRIYIHYRPKIFFQYLASSVPYVRISTIKRVTYVTFTKYYRSLFVFERVSIYVTINERQARSEFI